VAAVLYGVGARLDHSPEMLFLLRGVNHEELVDVSAAVSDAGRAGSSRRRIAAAGVADVLGIDMAEPADHTPEQSAARAKKAPAREKSSREEPFPAPLTGAAISAWRAFLGESQATFAARIGVTAASISQWEKKGPLAIGTRPGTLAALRKAWQQTRT
jgi:DNA-binding transcriptional regulator YiaG